MEDYRSMAVVLWRKHGDKRDFPMCNKPFHCTCKYPSDHIERSLSSGSRSPGCVNCGKPIHLVEAILAHNERHNEGEMK